MRSTTEITAFHAHVYFDAATREIAQTLRDAIAARFTTTRMGRIHDAPVGPHTLPMFEVAFSPDQFAAFVPWLMLNRSDLAILVHPMTTDMIADHTTNALWLGPPVAIDVAVLRHHAAIKALASCETDGAPRGARAGT